jgi:hypothetical protein
MKFSLLVLLLLVVGCAPRLGVTPEVTAIAWPKPVSDNVEPEEYGILSALIDELYVNGNIAQVVISDHTYICDVWDTVDNTLHVVDRLMPGVAPDTRDDYAAKNQHVYSLQDAFHLKVKSVLIRDQEFRELWDGDPRMERFYAKYPKSQGYMHVSRVGLNTAGDEALVCIGNSQMPLVGATYYVWLSKQNGTWVIRNKVVVLQE